MAGRSWDPSCVLQSDELCSVEGRVPYLCHCLFIFLLNVNTLKGQKAGNNPIWREAWRAQSEAPARVGLQDRGGRCQFQTVLLPFAKP